jgi:hypothetical protein
MSLKNELKSRSPSRKLPHMALPLPIDWGEAEKACLAGVPMHQVAQAMATRAGLDGEKLYATMRKRASRERWPVPDAIVRRAQAQARVASGAADGPKKAAGWQAGQSGLDAVMQSRDAAGVNVPRASEALASLDAGEYSGSKDDGGADVAEAAAGDVAGAVRGAFPPAPVTAAELVTADLSQLGQRGLRAILSTAVNAAESMQQAPDIRSWNDVQVMTKVISQAAGLDKPGVAVAVSLNNATNATIAAWTEADIVDTIG